MSRVEFLWHDHECYTVKLNGTTVGMLYKRQIKKALLQYEAMKK